MVARASLRFLSAHQWRHRRDLTIALVRRDLKLRYKGSLLGIAWGLVTPLAQLLVFVLVFRGVVRVQVPHYASYVFSGVLAWNWFQTSLYSASTALLEGRGLLRRPGFPAAVLPATTVVSNFVHYLLALPILIALLVYDDVGIHRSVTLLPLALLVQFALTLGLGLLVSVGQVLFRDTQQLMSVALMLTFYLTPVFYDTESVPDRYRWIFDLNPLVYLMQAYRALLIGGHAPSLESFVPLAVGSILILLLGLRVVSITQHRLVEEL